MPDCAAGCIQLSRNNLLYADLFLDQKNGMESIIFFIYKQTSKCFDFIVNGFPF